MAGITGEFSERDWLSRKRAALFLAERGCPVSLRTLARWASNNNRGGGPPFTRIRWRFVRYLRADLERWIAHEAQRIQ